MRRALPPLAAALALAAGCLGAPAPPLPLALDLLPEPVPVVMPFSSQGAAEGRFCAANTSCAVLEESRDVMLPHERPLRRIDLNVTWAPRGVGSLELEVYLLRVTPDGVRGWEDSVQMHWKGRSPLPLVVDLPDEVPHDYRLHARASDEAPGGSRVGGYQPYEVQGILTVLDRPALEAS